MRFSVSCLQDVFTELNNFSAHTVSDSLYDEYFRFTDRAVQRLLNDYGMLENTVKLRNGMTDIVLGRKNAHCPWDVLNYVKGLSGKPE